MATDKRASMREGPLAALFRRTDENQPEQKPQQEELEAPQQRPGNAGPLTGEQMPPAATPAAQQVAEPAYQEPPSNSSEQPKDRLARVFFEGTPDDILEPSSEGTAPRYGREIPDPYAAKTPSGPTQVVNPKLRVVGVGGAGVNAIDRMIEAGLSNVEFVAINTDMQSLQGSLADVKLHIGADLTRGLGAGADPDLGRQAAMADLDAIKSVLKGSDMIFIAAGSGGGTGTGAGPIIARVAREVDALTVGIVTTPFNFEGSRRSQAADAGIAEFGREVDTLITVPNNKLLSILDKNTSMVEAFRVADDVLRQGVQGISDLVTLAGLINIDFADVRTIMSDAGTALLGIGMGQGGESRAIEAASQAVSSPLLETSIDGARAILLSITGGNDLSLWEVNEAAKAVAEAAHPDANIIFGATVDPNIEGQVWVTVVATRYNDKPSAPRRTSAMLDASRADREPRVSRASSSMMLGDLDVPEFVPRG